MIDHTFKPYADVPDLCVEELADGETCNSYKFSHTSEVVDLVVRQEVFINKVADALENWNGIFRFKQEFIDKNSDPEGGEPLCGYEEWDEYMMDINWDLAEAGEILAEAVKEALK